MKTIVTFNGRTYVEANNVNVTMTDFVCGCGNTLHIPEAIVELGITTTCGHCNAEHGFPKKNHESAITEGYICLIEDEEEVDLS